MSDDHCLFVQSTSDVPSLPQEPWAVTPPASPTSLLEDSYDDNDDPETKQPAGTETGDSKGLAEKQTACARKEWVEQVQLVRAFVSQHCHLSRSPIYVRCSSLVSQHCHSSLTSKSNILMM